MMIPELARDHPLRNRDYWRENGYAAKLNRAWDVAERFLSEREAARVELASERARSAGP